MKLEKLLNSLIEGGRDPKKDGGIWKVTKDEDYWYLFHDKDWQWPVFSMRLRDIVSIESWL